jgi:hypothetical protein
LFKALHAIDRIKKKSSLVCPWLINGYITPVAEKVVYHHLVTTAFFLAIEDDSFKHNFFHIRTTLNACPTIDFTAAN